MAVLRGPQGPRGEVRPGGHGDRRRDGRRADPGARPLFARHGGPEGREAPGGGREAAPLRRDLPPEEPHRPVGHRPHVAGLSCGLAWTVGRRSSTRERRRGSPRRVTRDSTSSFALHPLQRPRGLGEWDLAFKALDEVRQKSRERENKYGIARGMNTTGWLHQQLGDLRHSVDFNRQALDFGRSAKLGNVEIYSTINLAEDHICLNEIGAAETILIDAAERLRTGAFDSHLWRWQMRVGLMFARLFLMKGDLDRADTHLTEALRIAEPTESGATWPRDTGSVGRSGSRPGERGRPDRASPCPGGGGVDGQPTNYLGDGRRARAGPRTRPGGGGPRRLSQSDRSAASSTAEDSPCRAQGHPPRVRTGRAAPRGGSSPRCHALSRADPRRRPPAHRFLER